ncbi:hypothetical protein QE362_001414 [Klebsiella variicola]|nr:hypothetical protein [Klebsiella variicola]
MSRWTAGDSSFCITDMFSAWNCTISPGYESGADFITCYEQERAHWRRVPVAATGCIAVFYRGEVPAHIGVMISPVKCLHARGEFGFVRCDSPLALLKVYSKVEYMVHGAI